MMMQTTTADANRAPTDKHITAAKGSGICSGAWNALVERRPIGYVRIERLVRVLLARCNTR